jgi:hypothetical protein
MKYHVTTSQCSFVTTALPLLLKYKPPMKDVVSILEWTLKKTVSIIFLFSKTDTTMLYSSGSKNKPSKKPA